MNAGIHKEREAVAGPPPAIGPAVAIARDWRARGVPVVAATSGLRDRRRVFGRSSPESYQHDVSRVFGRSFEPRIVAA